MEVPDPVSAFATGNMIVGKLLVLLTLKSLQL